MAGVACCLFFFQAEDGIRDWSVTGVQTCALPISLAARWIGSDDDAPYRRGQGVNAYVTRLHVRYDAKSFPEDLTLMETGDRSNFQGRYVLHHPWTGAASCDAGDRYRVSLPARFRQEARNLAGLTGWSRTDIERRMQADGQSLR